MPFQRRKWILVFLGSILACGAMLPVARADQPIPGSPPPAAPPKTPSATTTPPGGTRLAFGENSSWKPCHFGGDGSIDTTDESVTLNFGDPITGVRWEGDFPKDEYEVSLEARRVEGFDFFCALTLPIADSHFSVVLGGWGGSLVGISSIDGQDASNNSTMLIRNFTKDQWYKLRVRVSAASINVWLDDDDIITVDREGHQFSIRAEMSECKPVGLASYQTKAEIRNFVMTPIKP